jgi:hypothetical protein
MAANLSAKSGDSSVLVLEKDHIVIINTPDVLLVRHTLCGGVKSAFSYKNQCDVAWNVRCICDGTRQPQIDHLENAPSSGGNTSPLSAEQHEPAHEGPMVIYDSSGKSYVYNSVTQSYEQFKPRVIGQEA